MILLHYRITCLWFCNEKGRYLCWTLYREQISTDLQKEMKITLVVGDCNIRPPSLTTADFRTVAGEMDGKYECLAVPPKWRNEGPCPENQRVTLKGLPLAKSRPRWASKGESNGAQSHLGTHRLQNSSNPVLVALRREKQVSALGARLGRVTLARTHMSHHGTQQDERLHRSGPIGFEFGMS